MLSFIKNNNIRNKIIKRIFFTEKSVDKILKTKDYIELRNVIETFIKYIKSNDLDIGNLLEWRLDYINKEILRIIIEVYVLYTEELLSTGKIDFDDMIKIASLNKVKVNYKYIIIDELQDTSVLRLNLIKNILS